MDAQETLARLFQPTSCAWRTTKMKKIKFYTLLISIHVLRMEDDNVLGAGDDLPYYFNPRPPHGGRHLSPPRTIPVL